MFYFLLLFLHILFLESGAYHVLVSGICGAGHWAIPLTISKRLLTDDHFVTFILSEACANTLDPIIANDDKYKHRYQILYGDDSCHVFQAITKQLNVFDVLRIIYSSAKCLFDPLYYFLSITNIHSLDTQKHHSFHQILLNNYKHQNENNQHIFKDVAFNNTNPVDIILSDNFHFWGSALSKLYHIPVIIRSNAAGGDGSTFLFRDRSHIVLHKDTTRLDSNYVQKLKSFLYFTLDSFGLWLAQKPMNNHLKSFGIDANYASWSDLNKGSVFYMPLGSPFFSAYEATKPSLKQFGFIVDDISDDEESISEQYEPLIEWLEMKQYETYKVLLISMGSNVVMDDVHVAAMFDVFTNSDLLQKDKWRVLWALRQPNIEQIQDNELKKKLLNFESNDFLRIEPWIPQLYVLRKYENIAVFMTHCGSNGVHEALYAKKVILSFPHNVDQFWYAKRIKELRCGAIIDRDIKDLISFKTHFVDNLLLLMANVEEYRNNVLHVHNMIIDFHDPGTDAVVSWIKNIAKYGTKPLTNHNIYDEKDVIYWYQETDIDLFVIVAGFMAFVSYLSYRCIVCCCACIPAKKVKKAKIQ